MKIDFHCHSNASDGSYTPTKLVHSAKECGVEFLALTDHDTTDGLDEFFSVDTDINRIAGIELSVGFSGGELHIVGLFVDKTTQKLSELESDVKRFRKERNELMMKNLSTLVKKDVQLLDLVDDENAQLGRPHFAKYLLRNGFVATRQEAFDKYLGKGGVINAKKQRITIERALDAIKSAGGISVLAHPITLNLDDDKFDALVKTYSDLGLDAIEVYSSHNPSEKLPFYENIAKKYNLEISCGSDFHGANGSVLSLGANIGDRNPETIIEALYKRANKTY